MTTHIVKLLLLATTLLSWITSVSALTVTAPNNYVLTGSFDEAVTITNPTGTLTITGFSTTGKLLIDGNLGDITIITTGAASSAAQFDLRQFVVSSGSSINLNGFSTTGTFVLHQLTFNGSPLTMNNVTAGGLMTVQQCHFNSGAVWTANSMTANARLFFYYSSATSATVTFDNLQAADSGGSTQGAIYFESTSVVGTTWTIQNSEILNKLYIDRCRFTNSTVTMTSLRIEHTAGRTSAALEFSNSDIVSTSWTIQNSVLMAASTSSLNYPAYALLVTNTYHYPRLYTWRDGSALNILDTVLEATRLGTFQHPFHTDCEFDNAQLNINTWPALKGTIELNFRNQPVPWTQTNGLTNNALSLIFNGAFNNDMTFVDTELNSLRVSGADLSGNKLKLLRVKANGGGITVSNLAPAVNPEIEFTDVTASDISFSQLSGAVNFTMTRVRTPGRFTWAHFTFLADSVVTFTDVEVLNKLYIDRCRFTNSTVTMNSLRIEHTAGRTSAALEFSDSDIVSTSWTIQNSVLMAASTSSLNYPAYALLISSSYGQRCQWHDESALNILDTVLEATLGTFQHPFHSDCEFDNAQLNINTWPALKGTIELNFRNQPVPWTQTNGLTNNALSLIFNGAFNNDMTFVDTELNSLRVSGADLSGNKLKLLRVKANGGGITVSNLAPAVNPEIEFTDVTAFDISFLTATQLSGVAKFTMTRVRTPGRFTWAHFTFLADSVVTFTDVEILNKLYIDRCRFTNSTVTMTSLRIEHTAGRTSAALEFSDSDIVSTSWTIQNSVLMAASTSSLNVCSCAVSQAVAPECLPANPDNGYVQTVLAKNYFLTPSADCSFPPYPWTLGTPTPSTTPPPPTLGAVTTESQTPAPQTSSPQALAPPSGTSQPATETPQPPTDTAQPPSSGTPQPPSPPSPVTEPPGTTGSPNSGAGASTSASGRGGGHNGPEPPTPRWWEGDKGMIVFGVLFFSTVLIVAVVVVIIVCVCLRRKQDWGNEEEERKRGGGQNAPDFVPYVEGRVAPPSPIGTVEVHVYPEIAVRPAQATW